MNYDFVSQPNNLDDYRFIISNLSHRLESLSIDDAQIEHFYDVHHLRKSHSWLFKEFKEEMLAKSGGYGPHLTNPRMLKYWLEEFNSEKRELQILTILSDYLHSPDYLIPFQDRFEPKVES